MATQVKKILIVNTSGLGVGGITTHMINYITALKNQKDILTNITIVSSMIKNEEMVKKLKSLGCKVVFLPSRKKKIIKYSIALNKIMRNERFDILHVHGNSPTMTLELRLGKKNGIPTRVAHCHNSISNHPLIYKCLSPIFKSNYTKAVAASNKAGNWIFGKNNFIVLNNAIFVDKYQFSQGIRDKYRQLLKLSDSNIAIGMIGNINKQKNPFFVNQILKRISNKDLKNMHFFIVGDGPLKKDFQDRVRPFKEHISFLGIRNDIPSFLQALDVLIMPSLWEGLPMILIEAQAAGVKCIISDNISKEVKISHQDVISLPLSDKEWCSVLTHQDTNNISTRLASYNAVKNSLYNINLGVNLLRKIYDI